jgi:hypothetical protein
MLKKRFWFEAPASIQVLLKLFWGGLLVSGILLNPLFSYPGRDAGIFMYVGSLILKGKVPYLDVWENKGPLVFYINALGLSLGDGSRWGIWLMEFLFLAGAAWLCFSLIREVMGEFPALAGVFVMLTSAGVLLQGGNYSEQYSVLFSSLALWAFVKGTADPKKKIFDVLIGVSLGCNILLRPNNISMQVAIAGGYFVLALLSRDWRLLVRRAVGIGAGAVMVVIPVLLYFAAQGALAEMVNVVLKFNYQYSSDTGFTEVYHGARVGVIALGYIIPIVALAGYVLALFMAGMGMVSKTEFPPLLIIILIGAPLELLLSTLSGRSYLHYYIGWSSYLGLLCAFVIFYVSRDFTAKLNRYAIPFLLVLVFFSVSTKWETWKGYAAVFQNLKSGDVEYIDPISEYILAHTMEQDQVFVWGFRPIINFVSGRDAPVSFLPYPLVHVRSPLTDAWAEEFYDQLTANPPKLIINYIEYADQERIPNLDKKVRREQSIRWKSVVLASNYRDVLDFVEDNYEYVMTIEGADIYQLKASQP